MATDIQRMMNEAPSVIGMFSISLSSGESFQSAVRNIARNGKGSIPKLFRECIDRADCRESPDIIDNVQKAVSTLPEALGPFKRAMNMVMSTFESDDENERRDMMRDAEEMVLKGLSQVGNEYGSGLSTPCMVVFAMGIMLPMILISMLPMLSIGGSFRADVINKEMISMITLVLIPAFVCFVIISLRSRNPFLERMKGIGDILFMFPLLFIYPLSVKMESVGYGIAESVFISASLCSAAATVLMLPRMMKESKRRKNESVLRDSLFALGNNLSSGNNFDISLISALRARKDVSSLAETMERELRICRGDVGNMLKSVISPISPHLCGYYVDIEEASRKDIRYAGRLATAIAHQMQEQESVRSDIMNKLKNMTDMMTGTAMFFAPLILGMSMVMLGPLSKIAGTLAYDGLSSVLIVYLIELVALISLLSSVVFGKGGIFEMQTRFCMMMPISLLVFILSTRIPLPGM